MEARTPAGVLRPANNAATMKLLSLLRGLCTAAACLAVLASPARADEAAWSAMSDGAIVLLRHANAPGGGDPPGFKLDDCRTQRNENAVVVSEPVIGSISAINGLSSR